MIEYRYLGRLDYNKALKLQHKLAEEIRRGDRSQSVLLLLEHPPVITLGKHADESHILNRNIETVRIDRGGDVTYHGPGQLVGYPILRLADFRLSVRSYVNLIERSLTKLLSIYGVSARQDRKYPGVWVGDSKIAAIGINLSKGVTTHGFSLNVDVESGAFDGIIPCGITGRGVISLSAVSQSAINLETIAEQLAEIFIKELEAETIS